MDATLEKILAQLGSYERLGIGIIVIIAVIFILRLVFDFIKTQRIAKATEAATIINVPSNGAAKKIMEEMYKPVQDEVKSLGQKVDNLTTKTAEIGVYIGVLSGEIKESKITLAASEAKMMLDIQNTERVVGSRMDKLVDVIQSNRKDSEDKDNSFRKEYEDKVEGYRKEYLDRLGKIELNLAACPSCQKAKLLKDRRGA
jgi:maltodextrin utilization protein YvdJ